MTTTSLFIRNIDTLAVARIKRAAQVRGVTLAVFITALSAFHEDARARADAGDAGFQTALVRLGLESVRD